MSQKKYLSLILAAHCAKRSDDETLEFVSFLRCLDFIHEELFLGKTWRMGHGNRNGLYKFQHGR